MADKKEGFIRIEKAGFLSGQVNAPPSKSYTIRAVLAASLSGGGRVINPLFSEDTLAAISSFSKLGARIKTGRDYLDIKGFKGIPLLRGGTLNAGESGTLLRLLLAVAALGKGRFTINGEGTLLKRTNKPIIEALRQLGVKIKAQGRNFRLPIIIEGRGKISGGRVNVSAGISSQAISSLLFICAFARSDVEIIVIDNAVSRPYVDITLDVLSSAGIQVKRKAYRSFFIKANQGFKFDKEYVVPGDYSSAAFLIAAGVLVASDIVITNLRKDAQGDRKIIDILNKMGAKIRCTRGNLQIKGPFKLKGLSIDCRDIPDLVPVLAVAACFAKGKTRIYNIGHLAHKESNRIIAPAQQLSRLGADIHIGEDSLLIRGRNLNPGTVSSCNDHRIAMALAVAGLRTGGVVINKSAAIKKSYPGFIRDLRSLGAKIIASNEQM